jgi:hypothetical protein
MTRIHVVFKGSAKACPRTVKNWMILSMGEARWPVLSGNLTSSLIEDRHGEGKGIIMRSVETYAPLPPVCAEVGYNVAALDR